MTGLRNKIREWQIGLEISSSLLMMDALVKYIGLQTSVTPSVFLSNTMAKNTGKEAREAGGENRLPGRGFVAQVSYLVILLPATATLLKSTSPLFQLSLGLLSFTCHLNFPLTSQDWRSLWNSGGPKHSLPTCLVLTLVGSMAGLLALSLAFPLH